MNRISWLLPVVLAALVSGNVRAQEPVTKPQLHVGDRWSFRNIDLQKNEEAQSYEIRVTDVVQDQITLIRKVISSNASTDVGKETTETVDAATWTLHSPRIIEGKVVLLAFPLEVGKTWDYEYRTPSPYDANGTTYKVTAKVEKWEDVKTPAGTRRS